MPFPLLMRWSALSQLSRPPPGAAGNALIATGTSPSPSGAVKRPRGAATAWFPATERARAADTEPCESNFAALMPGSRIGNTA